MITPTVIELVRNGNRVTPRVDLDPASTDAGVHAHPAGAAARLLAGETAVLAGSRLEFGPAFLARAAGPHQDRPGRRRTEHRPATGVVPT